MDLEARDRAARAAAQLGPLSTRALGQVGTRIFGGRVYNVKSVDATGLTWEVLCGLAAPFDAVRVILAAGNTAGLAAVTPSVIASVAAVGAADDASVTAAAPVSVTFGGAGTAALAPSASSASRRWLVSDWLPLPSVPRTDGGALPLLAIRAWTFMPSGQAAGNMVVLGDGVQTFSPWSAHPSGRVWRMRSKGSQWTGSAWGGMSVANSSAQNGSPVVGVQYLARGKVVSVMGFGDSITEGQGGFIGEGFGMPACVALSGTGGVAWEWSNCGWSGQAMANIRANALDTLAAGLVPDIALVPCGSPNDVPSGAIPASGAGSPAVQRGQLALLLAQLAARRVEPVVWTWLPTNAAVRGYGASDALRRAYNDEVRGWAGRGMVVADFDRTLAGATDANGQVQMLAGATADGIHPGDPGNAALARVAAVALARVVQPGAGLLAA